MAAAPRACAILVLVATIICPPIVPALAQSPIEASELADYRLTAAVFERFVQANVAVVEITERDLAFADAPLFTKDFALSGDAAAEAARLMARLSNHAGLTSALGAAKITAREYSTFAMTLIAAHLAHGFLKSGAMSRVPPGAPASNVEFVKAHERDVAAALAALGIRP